MTEQIHEDQHMDIPPIEPLKTRHILAQNWTKPAKTLVAGILVSVLCIFMTPVYGITYVSALMPICILTAITQFSINIIKDIEKRED